MRSEPVTTWPLLARTSAMPLIPAPPMPIMCMFMGLIPSLWHAAIAGPPHLLRAGVASAPMRPASSSRRASSSNNPSTRSRRVRAPTSESSINSAAPLSVKYLAFSSWWPPVAWGNGMRIAALPAAAMSNSEPAPALLTTTSAAARYRQISSTYSRISCLGLSVESREKSLRPEIWTTVYGVAPLNASSAARLILSAPPLPPKMRTTGGSQSESAQRLLPRCLEDLGPRWHADPYGVPEPPRGIGKRG